MLGGEPLQEVVGVRCVANGERPDLALIAPAVEHHHPAGSAARDEAREGVNELLVPGELARMQEVVAVEQVERRFGHHASACAERWRRASYRSRAAATETFSDSTPSASGIDTAP